MILAHTIKGWTLGKDFEGRNATHQMKKLTKAELKELRDRLYIDLPRQRARGRPAAVLPPRRGHSDEIAYMQERRAALGGSRAAAASVRQARCSCPRPAVYDELKKGSGKQPVATTMAFVRLLKDLMKDKGIGQRIVPVIPDEARTFGIDAMFPTRQDLLARTASATRPSTARCCCRTRSRCRARSCTRASPRPARWRR